MPDLPQLSRSLLAYTMWADSHHLDSLAAIPVEHLTVATGTSFGSLLGTMAHILGSEQVWIARFVGAPLGRYPETSDYPDLAEWLMAEGIESMSLNPDTVVETWLHLAKSATPKVAVGR